MSLKILSIVGARPQFIKVGALLRVVGSLTKAQHVLIHTGQHYDDNMSRVFFDELDLTKPDYDLGIGSATHGAQTGRMLEAIEQIVLNDRPDLMVVYGDTNSTLAGALAAVKLHVPVAHVEAGLRSFNRQMPEEINRVLTDHVADLLFAPTTTAVDHLAHEGIGDGKVFFSGDVMYDAALYYGAKAEQESRIIQKLGLQNRPYILATIHRAENTDDPERLRDIFAGLDRVAKEIPVILPLHPRTRAAWKHDPGLGDFPRHVVLIEPVGYLDMAMLEKHSRLIATDSGGVQKEAFFYGKPCVTLRDETEWTELVELGWNRLVPPTSSVTIAESLRSSLDQRGAPASPYGNGNAARTITEIIMRWAEQLD